MNSALRALLSRPANQSPALAFVVSGFKAIPRGDLCERDRITALNAIMRLAIECQMAFEPDDAQALVELTQHTAEGVFRPLDPAVYALACRHGGTYPIVWERHAAMEPWIAARAYVPTGQGRGEIRTDQRVASGIAVLLAGKDTDPLLPRSGPHQVWWCTGMEHDKALGLARYRLVDANADPYAHDGPPTQRCSFNQETWAIAQAQVRAASPDD